MALTNAEHQKRWRENQKIKRKENLKQHEAFDLTKVIRTPFFEAFDRHGESSLFECCMDTAGIEPPTFDDDSPPRSATGEVEMIFHDNPEDNLYYGHNNSLARAEIMIGQLIDASAALAQIVNDFKRSEIDARISELEQSDLSEPAAKKQAFADMAKLQKMRKQLDKQVRWTFPQWKMTGE